MDFNRASFLAIHVKRKSGLLKMFRHPDLLRCVPENMPYDANPKLNNQEH